MKRIFFSLSVILVVSCAHEEAVRELASSPKTIIPIAILHTNDIHGHAWSREKGKQLVGGFAAQAALIDRIRKELADKGGLTLVLNAGDENTGFPESDLLDAEPDFRAMSMIKYDAMALGNHEFDGGLEKLDRQQSWIHFPLLSANVVLATAKPVRESFVIIEKEGVKFGIVGLTTDTLKRVVLARNVAELNVLDPIETAQTEIPKLKDANADILIAVTHLGVTETGKRAAEKIGRDDTALAKAVPDLNFIVGGHSHTLLPHGLKINSTLITQAGEKGEYLGRIDFNWDRENKKILGAKASVIPILPAEGEDAKVKKMLDGMNARVATQLSAEIGVAETDLDGDRERVRHAETNLGNYICDVLRFTMKSDACIYNSGGIRASIPKGKFQMRDLYRVLPFRNTIVTGELTGKQLKEVLQSGLSHQDQTGSFLQVSGIEFFAKKGAVTQVKVNGAVIADSAIVKIVSNSFVFEGGDFLDVMKSAKNVKDHAVPVEQMIAKYLRYHPEVYPKRENRIHLD